MIVPSVMRDFSVIFVFLFSWTLERHHAFAIAIPEFSESYFTSEGNEGITRSRLARDIGAATWPLVDEIELEVHPRSPRSPETHEESVIMIRDFWLNFGKTGDEINNESESEVVIIENQGNTETEDADAFVINIEELGESSRANNDDDDVDETLPLIFDAGTTQENPQTMDFRYSAHDRPFTLYPDPSQNIHAGVLVPQFVPSPQPPYSQLPSQYPSLPSNPQQQYYTGNVNAPSTTPGYSHRVLIPSTTLNPESALKYPHSYKPAVYAPPGQILPSSISRHDQYGIPSPSISPYMFQQMLMNSNSQNHGLTTPSSTAPYGSTYPSTVYSNPSVPPPNYSYMPSNPPDFRAKSSPYAKPVSSYPTVPVSSGPPPIPSYPYSLPNNYY